MDSLIETVSITFSLVSLFLIPFILFIAYLIKRNGFYVDANCWFCNTCTKVLYADRNSFYCPSCEQYNGFNKDGDYNKVIEAQYDTSVNKYYNTTQNTTPVSNGLCTYCNNNQQLKIYQLANFVPLNENNYDIEIEHFEKQLEKAYKLCKKCDNILKRTIEKQHAWIFGNRLKSFQKIGFSSFGLSTAVQNGRKTKRSFFLNLIKYTLVLFCVLIISHTMDIKVKYPISKLNKYVPNIFEYHTVFLKDIFNSFSNASENINACLNEFNSFLPKYIKLDYSNIVLMSGMGLLLHFILLLCDQRSVWWKINELMGWTLLVTTSLILFDNSYSAYIKILQAFCSAIIICSLLSKNKLKELKKTSVQKKFEFKKLNKHVESRDCSDIEEEVSEGSNSSIFSKNSGKSMKSNRDLNASYYQSSSPTSQGFLFQNKVQNTANVNDNFTTARSIKTASMLNKSVKSESNLSSGSELHRSLDNLHLSNLNVKPQICTSPVFSITAVNRPILSPPKLKNITQNSWTAGGFWKNDTNSYPVSSEFTNLSRSSSQTSGFVSNNDPAHLNPFSSLSASREPSVCGDFERTSVLSESQYLFQPINSNGLCSLHPKNHFLYNPPQSPRSSLSPNSNQLYYKADNNMFYPVLNQNNMLFIHTGNISRNFESSFNNLSLKGFNINSNRITSPPLFGKQPVVSSLFKNLPGLSMQSHSFKTPHC